MSIRKCIRCGDPYQASRSTAKYCSTRCRVYASQERRAALPVKTGGSEKPKPSLMVEVDQSAGLITATRGTLEAAGRLDSVAGQSAIRIAEAMTGRETGAGLAALSKALSATMAEALDGVVSQADSLDELKARREARRAG